jgi:hypothetical protein
MKPMHQELHRKSANILLPGDCWTRVTSGVDYATSVKFAAPMRMLVSAFAVLDSTRAREDEDGKPARGSSQETIQRPHARAGIHELPG